MKTKDYKGRERITEENRERKERGKLRITKNSKGKQKQERGRKIERQRKLEEEKR